jgi:hypothetical protein
MCGIVKNNFHFLCIDGEENESALVGETAKPQSPEIQGDGDVPV